MKPLLRWVGGKSRLLPTLRDHLPANVDELRHVELFAGSGALFFDRQPKRALLSDLCVPLMNAYVSIRMQPAAVLRSLNALQRYRTSRDYGRIRARFNAGATGRLGDPKRAAAFLYLNAVGFNGIWRENAKGEMNTPFGEWPRAGIYRRDRVFATAAALQGVEHHAADAFRLMNPGLLRQFGEGDFVYLDPPYLPRSPGSFRGYGAGVFRLREHAELARGADRLAAAGAKVMISNADTWVARELYRGWHLHRVETHTSVAASSKARGAQAELLITSYPMQRKRLHKRASGCVAVAQGGRCGAASAASKKAS